MPLRDLTFITLIFALLPVCFMWPWVGVLVWSWISYMNPHRHAWTEARYFFQPALLVGVATIAGAFVTRQRKPFIWCAETVLLLILWGWFLITTINALYPEEAWKQFDVVSKVMVVTFLTIPLFQDRRKLRLLLLVIALSVGFYGFKGGLFVLASGGNYMVLGAPGRSFISANNAVALALNMTLPLLLYLGKEEPRRWLRHLLYATFFLSIVAVPFCYSRGGVIGLVGVLALLFLKTPGRSKVLVVPVAVAIGLAFAVWVPDKWLDRMETMQHYENDPSANARLFAWRIGRQLAADHPIFGGGFEAFGKATWLRYLPTYPNFHDAHSIYFNLLGEHGYIGLTLFILLILCLLNSIRKVRKAAKQVPDMRWLLNYADMLQVSIIAYLVTGAFLSVAYFDYAYHLFVIVVILKKLAADELAKRVPAAVRVQPPRSPVGSRAGVREGLVEGPSGPGFPAPVGALHRGT